MIEAVFTSQLANLLEKVLPKGAANTAVGHFDHFFIRMGERGVSVANLVGIDIDLRHVVNDDGNLAAFAITQDMVQERCLS